MKSIVLGSAASVLVVGLALAQATTTPAPSTGPAVPPSTPSTVARPTTGTTTTGSSVATPTANSNQAIATGSVNASQPAKGASSFTEAEARRRIEAAGFSDVTGLAKDTDGVWHGKAKKGGSSTEIWLDYKGSTGITGKM